MSVKINVTGINEVMYKLDKLDIAMRSKVEKALLMGASTVLRDAKLKAPYDTTRLRTSLTLKTEDFGTFNPTVYVGTNASRRSKKGKHVQYGKFQEFGTGRRGRASKVKTPAEYEYGSLAGNPAQPFLFPALNENKELIKKLIANAMKSGGG